MASQPLEQAVDAVAKKVENLEEIAGAIEEGEETTDNDVAIAAIDAEKEVAIAEINADARKEEASAYAEAKENEKENDPWTTLNLLMGKMQEMQSQITVLSENLQASSPSPVEATEEIAEELAEELEALEMENNSTQQSTSAPTSETEMEATQKSEEEKPEEKLVPPLVEIDTPTSKKVIRLI